MGIVGNATAWEKTRRRVLLSQTILRTTTRRLFHFLSVCTYMNTRSLLSLRLIGHSIPNKQTRGIHQPVLFFLCLFLPLFDFLCHSDKRLLHILRSFRRGFQKLDSQRIRKLFRCCSVYNLFRRQVILVANQKFVHTLIRISINFVQPGLDIVERFLVGNVYDI